MIFGVGTGKCGTKSIAMINGIPHQPPPIMVGVVSKYYNSGKKEKRKELLERLKGRKKTSPQGWSDMRNSLCLDLIKELFPQSNYIWAIRDPYSFIQSIMNIRWYGSNDDGINNRRIFPNGNGFGPSEDSRAKKIAWYWLTVNKLIESDLAGTNYKVFGTHDLKEHHGKAASYKKYIFNKDEEEYIQTFLIPYWNDLRRRYDISCPSA